MNPQDPKVPFPPIPRHRGDCSVTVFDDMGIPKREPAKAIMRKPRLDPPQEERNNRIGR